MGRTVTPTPPGFPGDSMQVLPRVTGTESAAITWSGSPGKPGVLQPVREGTLPAAPRPAFPPRPPIPVLSPQISTRPSCFPQTILTCPLEGHLKPVLRPKPQVLTVTEVPSLKREELSLCRAGLAWNHDSGLFMTPRQKPVLYKHSEHAGRGWSSQHCVVPLEWTAFQVRSWLPLHQLPQVPASGRRKAVAGSSGGETGQDPRTTTAQTQKHAEQSANPVPIQPHYTKMRCCKVREQWPGSAPRGNMSPSWGKWEAAAYPPLDPSVVNTLWESEQTTSPLSPLVYETTGLH